MGNRRQRRILWAVVALILAVLWAVCALRVNHAYPQAVSVQAGMNEPLRYGPYTLTLTQARIEDTAALYAENGLATQGAFLPEKTLLCTVNVGRDGAAQEEPGMLYAAAVSGAWQCMADRGEMYGALDLARPDLSEVQPGEPQTWLFLFGLYRETFSEESWERLTEKTFTLQFSLYPEKREILFQPESA